MAATAYPLTWPPGFPRTQRREPGKFKTSLEAALKNVESSLRLFGTDSRKPIAGLVISSNYTLGSRSPADPGVAVYFTWDGLQVCIPVDRYASLAANLQAIHHIVEARRVELRHGTLALVRATFQGFAALPAPDGHRHWSGVLALPRNASRDAIEAAYRDKSKRAHPDAGGSTAAMTELTAARDAALKEIGG
jgi:hypothetical protein